MFNRNNSNEQKCRLVVLVPLQTFRIWPFITLESIVVRFAYAEIKEKEKKEKLCSSRAALPRTQLIRIFSVICFISTGIHLCFG